MLSLLFEPTTIGRLRVNNRFVVPAMGVHYANPDGTPGDRIAAYYAARARGGFGLIVTEVTSVSPEGRLNVRQLGLWDDRQIPAWANLAKEVHTHGAKLAPQLHLAGNKARPNTPGVRVMGPSPLSYVPPRGRLVDLDPPVAAEMTAEDIGRTVEAFGEAARRAREAGCDGIEVHGAHGYLLAQFLSPAENKRIDGWGGGVEGRIKLAVDVVKKIKDRAGADFPVIFKISADEMQPGGRTLEETQLIAWLLARSGVDCLCLSRGSNSYSPHWMIPPSDVPPAPWVTRETWLVKQAVDIPVIAVGKILDPLMGEFLLQTGKADLIAFGRASFVDPDLPVKAAASHFDRIRPCIGCNSCVDSLRTGDLSAACAMNPELGKEKQLFPLTAAGRIKKVLVAGGGPGGLEAARVAALRGHNVTLYEKEDRMGGQMWLATLAPGKQQFAAGLKWLWAEARKAGAKFETGSAVTPDLVARIKPDVVIVATGGAPHIPREVPGIDKPQVVTAVDVLNEKVRCGRRVVILGANLIGCEAADWLGWRRRAVTLVKMRPGCDVAEDLSLTRRPYLLDRLAEWKVRIVTGTKTGVKIKEITDAGVVILRDGEEETLVADSVVLALGTIPVNALAEQLKGQVSEIHVVGDGAEPRRIVDAVAEGNAAARQI